MENFSLYIDEAYYWTWAQNPQFGYYSKPPMIAWLIMLTTSIFSNTEIALKLGALLIYPITSCVIYLISNRLFNDTKISFYSAISFITIPAVSMSSLIISTDVILLLYWSLSMLFFIKALQEESNSSWLIAGFFAGCGLLSKYNMIFFIVSVVLILVLNKDYREHFKNKYFYFALIVAVLVFMPNLYWQYQNNFISFEHTKEISQIEKKDLFHINKMFEFLGAQLGVFGPLFFPFLFFLLFKFKTIFENNSLKFLYLFVAPYFIFITILSLLSRAFANWSAPIYVAGIILVVSYLVKIKKIKLINLSIVINLLLAMILYFYHPITNTLGIELTKKNDPYARIYGWEKLAKELDGVREKYNYRLIFQGRKVMSEMIFYMKPHPFNSLIYNPKKIVQNQYHMKNSLKKAINETFLYIAKGDNVGFAKKFDKIKLIKNIEIKLYKDYSLKYNVYLVKNFKGY